MYPQPALQSSPPFNASVTVVPHTVNGTVYYNRHTYVNDQSQSSQSSQQQALVPYGQPNHYQVQPPILHSAQNNIHPYQFIQQFPCISPQYYRIYAPVPSGQGLKFSGECGPVFSKPNADHSGSLSLKPYCSDGPNPQFVPDQRKQGENHIFAPRFRRLRTLNNYSKIPRPSRSVGIAVIMKQINDEKELEKPNICSIPPEQIKQPLSRYDSDDSGFAESPLSTDVPATWPSDSDIPVNSDSEKNKNNLTQESATDDNKSHSASSDNKDDTNSSSDNESNDGDSESGWTIEKDNLYWRLSGRRPPPNHLMESIALQIDYYLSDEYLIQDKYLLRQIRCKKNGFISIKLITSFKKVRKLTPHWDYVRTAILRKSKTIVVSSEGYRIRRREPLSDVMRKPRKVTTIIVIRLPKIYNSVQRLIQLFSHFGEIGFVRLIRPGKDIPPDLRNYATQVHDLGITLSAVIDYEHFPSAMTAVREITYFLRQHESKNESAKTFETQDEKKHHENQKALKDFPDMGNLRLALLGPRVKRTLYGKCSDNMSCEELARSKSKKSYPGLLNSKNDFSPVRNVDSHDRRHRSASVSECVRQPRGPADDDKGFKVVRSTSF